MQEVKDRFLVKTTFYILGVGALLAWNAILSELDFFIHFQEKYSPGFIYPNMNFVLNVVFQFFLLCSKKKISYKIQIIFSLVISIWSLIALPAAVVWIGGLTGFIVSSIMILLQGLANAIILSCLYALVSFLPFDYIIAMSTGQGMAGVLMNVIRYVILFSMGSDPKDEPALIWGSLIFFGISAMILVICLVFLVLVYQDKFFIHHLRQSGEFPDIYYEKLTEGEEEKKTDDGDQVVNVAEKSLNEPNEKTSEFTSLMVKLLDINYLVFLNYVITFAVFPGVSIRPGLFKMSDGFRINTLICIYNVFDTVGRKFPGIVPPSKKGYYLIVFLRFFVLITFPLLICMENAHWFHSTVHGVLVVVNMMLFSFSNGYATSCSFSFAPDQVPDHMKGKAGSSVSFFLIVGIFSGTLFATFVMQNLI